MKATSNFFRKSIVCLVFLVTSCGQPSPPAVETTAPLPTAASVPPPPVALDPNTTRQKLER